MKVGMCEGPKNFGAIKMLLNSVKDLYERVVVPTVKCKEREFGVRLRMRDTS